MSRVRTALGVALVSSLAVGLAGAWGVAAQPGGVTVTVRGAPPRATIGLVKVARGGTWLQRAGTLYAAAVGAKVWESDVLLTGADGALGVTFVDETLLSLGPNSAFGLARYEYDPVTQVGRFETIFYRGTMSMSAGRMVRKSGASMSIATPQSTVRVRGTTFALRVGGDE